MMENILSVNLFCIHEQKACHITPQRHNKEGIIWRLLPEFSPWTLLSMVVKMTTNIRHIIILEAPRVVNCKVQQNLCFPTLTAVGIARQERVFYPNSQFIIILSTQLHCCFLLIERKLTLAILMSSLFYLLDLNS